MIAFPAPPSDGLVPETRTCSLVSAGCFKLGPGIVLLSAEDCARLRSGGVSHRDITQASLIDHIGVSYNRQMFDTSLANKSPAKFEAIFGLRPEGLYPAAAQRSHAADRLIVAPTRPVSVHRRVVGQHGLGSPATLSFLPQTDPRSLPCD